MRVSARVQQGGLDERVRHATGVALAAIDANRFVEEGSCLFGGADDAFDSSEADAAAGDP